MFKDRAEMEKPIFFTNMAFIFGLTMSLMIGLLCFYFLKAVSTAKISAESNEKLVFYK